MGGEGCVKAKNIIGGWSKIRPVPYVYLNLTIMWSTNSLTVAFPYVYLNMDFNSAHFVKH